MQTAATITLFWKLAYRRQPVLIFV